MGDNMVCINNINEKDDSENVNYNVKGYPVYIHKSFLSQYPNYSCISHWHEDLEFIVVLSGQMYYNINGKIIKLLEGNGILINSRRFHYGYSENATECDFICILLHPSLFCVNEYFENLYVSPIIGNEQENYLLLEQQIAWQQQILFLLKEIYESSKQNFDILAIQQQIFTLWKILYSYFPIQKNNVKYNRQLTVVIDMVAFIQSHYKEKISLDMIADSGKVCKSSCSALFQKYLSQTPITYLTKYRLNKSLDLLFGTDMQVTEISYEVGFSNASYYAETFKKYYHCTPKEYVKIHKN